MNGDKSVDPRLGRGLGAMLSETASIRAGTAHARGGSGFARIPIDRVVPETWHADRPVSEQRIARLADSIRKHGLLEPVIARRDGDDYALLIGLGRWLAAREAGLADLPAILVEHEGQDAFDLFLEHKQTAGVLDEEERVHLRLMMQKLLGVPGDEALRRLPDPEPAAAPAPAAPADPSRHPLWLAAGLLLALLLAGAVVWFPHPARSPETTGTAPESIEELLAEPPPAAAVPPPATSPKESETAAPQDRSWMRAFVLPGVTLDPGPDALVLVFEQGVIEGRDLREGSAALLDRVAARIAALETDPGVTVTGHGDAPWLAAALAAERLSRILGMDRLSVEPAGDRPPPYPETPAFESRNRTVTLTLRP